MQSSNDHDYLDALSYSMVRARGEPVRKNPCAEIELPDFQAIGRACREIKHPIVKMIEMPISVELQAEIDNLRELFKKNLATAPVEWRMPIIGDDGGHPKCECGKDKHGFAFHMRFCPKWEPIC